MGAQWVDRRNDNWKIPGSNPASDASILAQVHLPQCACVFLKKDTSEAGDFLSTSDYFQTVTLVLLI